MRRDTSGYDAVPYDERVFYRTHPDVLATLATLHGIDPVPVERCRVLELGCAVGGNLIPMALGLPAARFVGVDLSRGQIATGREVVRALGLDNVELHAMSITDVDAGAGTFDYVVCHGVYSWVPPAVQDAILDVCGRVLSPNGIAYVSYNTYPGWHLRGVARDLMQYHGRRYDTADDQVREARAFLELVLRVQRARTTESAFGAALEEEARLVRDAPDDYVFHEHLEDCNAPLYFEEMVRRAGTRGLSYLDDARPRDVLEGLGDDLRLVVARLAANPIEREQYLDFLFNRTFRRSLFCRAACRPDPDRRADRVATLFVTARVEPVSGPSETPGGAVRFRSRETTATMTTDDPALTAALFQLAEAWPHGLPFAALPCDDRGTLAGALLRCYLAGLVELRTRSPSCAATASARPTSSPLARLQAGRQARVTNLLHRVVVLDDGDRVLLGLLDGSRDGPALVDALTAAFREGTFRLERGGRTVDDPVEMQALIARWLEPALDRLARAALLVA